MPKLKLSAPDWCFYRDTLAPERYYTALAALGIQGVEMVDPARWPAARAAGLAIVNLCAPGMQQGLNSQANHAELIPGIAQSIALAAKEQIPAVIVFSGNRNGLSDKLGIANCVQALRQLAPLAEKAGVQLHFEMLCAMDHADYHADRSAFGFEVVRQVASPAVKVLYDIYHMHRMGEDVGADLLGHLDDIAHIHVAESPRRTVPVARGEIDYHPLVARVQAAGYPGYWGLEFLPTRDVMTELTEVTALFRGFAG